MKIFCIGRNYAEHARELGNVVPSEPVIFMKPESALLIGGGQFTLPPFSRDVQHEAELVLRIAKRGKYLSPADAEHIYDAIGIGIDITARDLQSKLKTAGLPWEKAKAFDQSAPVSSEFIPRDEFADLRDISFRLLNNDSVVQIGNTADLLFDFAHLLAHISIYFTLQPGDLVFTGTPEGVGPMRAADVLDAYIGERLMLKLQVSA